MRMVTRVPVKMGHSAYIMESLRRKENASTDARITASFIKECRSVFYIIPYCCLHTFKMVGACHYSCCTGAPHFQIFR